MLFGKIFLTLPLKTQIYFALFLLTIICFCLMFIFIIILTSRIISSKKLYRKKYFYDLQYKIIISNIFFQNICILQYEQLMKTINIQVYYFTDTLNILTKNENHTRKETCKEYNSSIYEEEFNKNKYGNYTMLYYHCYGNKTKFNEILPLVDESILLFTKQVQSIRIPYYGEDISLLNRYLFILYRYYGYFSLDINSIKEFYDENDDNKVNSIATYGIIVIRNEYKIYFEKYEKGELHFLEYMFPYSYNIFENYNNKTLIEQKYNNSIETYIDTMSYYFNFFEYGRNHMYLTDNSNINYCKIITGSNFIDNYLEFIYNLLLKMEEINVIPLYNKNNTLLSEKLCIIFIIKQLIYLKTKKYKNSKESGDELFVILEEIIPHLKKGKSKIDDCFISNYIDIFEKKFGKKYNDVIKSDKKEIFLHNFENYYNLNFTESFMYFKLSNSEYGKNFFGVKYQFPNYKCLVNFQITYFSFNLFNVYAFSTFFPIYKYWLRSIDILDKCLYFIILLLIYLWLICSFILFYIARKIIDEVIKPIIHLQSLIDGKFTSIQNNKEKNINYNIDENINSLYILINNLVNNNKLDDQKFGSSNENSSEDMLNNKEYNNNLRINQELIIQNQNKENNQEKIINHRIASYRDYNIGNKNQSHKQSSKKVFSKNIYCDGEKNYLYRELMKVVECTEKPLQNSKKDFRKIYKSKKTIGNEDLNDSFEIYENSKNNNKHNKQKLHKNKKNILYHWYFEAKDKIENNCFDIEKEKIKFCKTNYNFN